MIHAASVRQPFSDTVLAQEGEIPPASGPKPDLEVLEALNDSHPGRPVRCAPKSELPDGTSSPLAQSFMRVGDAVAAAKEPVIRTADRVPRVSGATTGRRHPLESLIEVLAKVDGAAAAVLSMPGGDPVDGCAHLARRHESNDAIVSPSGATRISRRPCSSSTPGRTGTRITKRWTSFPRAALRRSRAPTPRSSRMSTPW